MSSWTSGPGRTAPSAPTRPPHVPATTSHSRRSWIASWSCRAARWTSCRSAPAASRRWNFRCTRGRSRNGPPVRAVCHFCLDLSRHNSLLSTVDSRRISCAGGRLYPHETELLKRLWFPVARESDVDPGPVAAELLGQKIVLYRTSAGITAAGDRCPHRWVRLSLRSEERR